MNRLLKLSAVLLCFMVLFISFSAYAAGERIVTSDVKVKTDRLFEVKIGFNSSRTITAARFTLTYSKNDIVARKPVCNLSSAQVRFNDKNGSTDIIFLCANGVRCGDFPVLFSMKYKKISGNNTTVKVKAYDCVDSKLKNFTPPASAVCKVYSDGKSGSGGKFADGSDGSGNDIADLADNNGDILDTAGAAGVADSENPALNEFGGEDSILLKFVPLLILLVILVFLGLILHQNVQLKKSEKRREEEQPNNDKD